MSVRQIAIIGYGIIGQQIRYFLEESHKGGAIRFSLFDDRLFAEGAENAFPFEAYQQEQFDKYEFYIGLGYKHLCLRKRISESLISMNRRFPSLIHHTAYLHPSVSVGYGSVIYPMCNIGFSVKIGNGTIINKSCTISHDSALGNGSFISPSVTFCGDTKLGDSSFIGAGTIVANEVSIGNRVVVGLGSVITNDIEDGLSVIGNPARIVSKLNIK